MLGSTLIIVCCTLLAGSHHVEPKTISLQKAGLKPLSVNAASRPLMKSPGQGGTLFDDLTDFHLTPSSIVGVHSINVSSGDQIDSVHVTYILSNGSLFQAPRRGKISHTPVNITLTPEEYIMKIEGKTNGELVDQLTITTIGPDYEMKVYGPFGKTGLLSFSFESHIVGFHGRAGNLLDSIGVYGVELLKKSDLFGGTGGSEFDDRADITTPPILEIAQLHIWNGDFIDAIQVEYAVLGGSFLLGKKHGGNSGNLTTVTFDEGEHIVALLGQTGDNYLNQLTFVTMKANGSEAKYGPFGNTGKDPFSVHGNILGFYGYAGSLLDKIGVYFI